MNLILQIMGNPIATGIAMGFVLLACIYVLVMMGLNVWNAFFPEGRP